MSAGNKRGLAESSFAYHHSVEIKSSRVCGWEINAGNESFLFAPRVQVKMNQMEEKSSKDFVTAGNILEIKSAAVYFLNRVRKEKEAGCVPSRSPELIHLDTDSENIPNPFYTQATADKLPELFAFILWTSTCVCTNMRCFKDMVRTSLA